MGGFEAERHLEQMVRAVEEPSDLFGPMNEASLDSLYAPLIYLSSGSEMGVYRTLTLEGKRRFLRSFWGQRDPTPGTAENEEMTAFYRRIKDANVRFREGGSAEVPGWRTDRGRVFIRYGEPDLVLKRPQTGPDRPWEAWRYTKQRELKFVFLDQTRVGNFSLIYTNDRLERTPPDWTRLLSRDAIDEIASF